MQIYVIIKRDFQVEVLQMSFRIPCGDNLIPDTITGLFTKLGKLDSMSFQQRDTLLEYEDVRKNHGIIAIELPVGHGKTLVGGLMGEFNRLTKRWRVVYTCATRQLAYQTRDLLISYGIEAVTLVGKAREFSSSEYGKYTRAEAIVIITFWIDLIFTIFSSKKACRYS